MTRDRVFRSRRYNSTPHCRIFTLIATAKGRHAMTEGRPTGHGLIYPAYCHNVSPTYWKWVKLTAADVHALRAERGFEGMTRAQKAGVTVSTDICLVGQDVYFHLNHPIRYVYLCGTVVAVDYFARFAILTLDDGSGQTLELKIELVVPPKKNLHDLIGIDDTKTAPVRQYGPGGETSTVGTPLEPVTIATAIANVTVTKVCSDRHCFNKHVTIDKRLVEVGMIIKARGTLGQFRGTFQLRLRRTSVVQDTEEELRIWQDYADFCNQVLIRPWHLTADEVQKLEYESQRQMDEKAQSQKRLDQVRQAAQQKRTKKREAWLAKVQRDEERLERRRMREERDMDGNALDRPRQLKRRESDAQT